MLTLNIILLIASVLTGVVGIKLIVKSRPIYTLVYPEKTARKVSIEKYFYAFSIMTILYFLLNCFGVCHPYTTILYLILSKFIILNYSIWYSSMFRKEKKNISTWILAFIGIAISINLIFFFMIPHLTVVLSMLIVTIYIVYWIFRLNEIGYNHYLYFYIYIWLAYACFFNFFLSVIMRLLQFSEAVLEHKDSASINLFGFSEIYVIIQYILIFFMFLSILLLILDIKKHSPMYEKQYIEENSLQTDGSNTL